MTRMLSFLFVLTVFAFFVSCGDSKVNTNHNNDDSDAADNDSVTDETADENADSTADENNDSVSDDTADEDAIPETCGNSSVDTGEICDGNVINCVEIDAQKYKSGKAKCLDTCLGWNTETCEEIPQTCGNSEVEGTEECDGNVVNCSELDPEKYYSGKAKCLEDCTGFDTATCEEYTNECGNTIVETPEVCDGGLKNCTEINADLYKGGKAYCAADCKSWDTVTCEEKIPCTDTVRVVDCSTDSSLDQIQTCFEGEWSDQGGCLDPAEYALLEKDASASELNIEVTATPDGTDVLFILDTSGSMSAAIDIIKSSMSAVTSDIRTDIPDSDFGLVTLGTLGYNPFTAVQNITSDTSAISTAAAGLAYGNGSDEYHTLTLEHSASGTAVTQSIRTTAGGTVYPTNISAATCSVGLRGGVCFRENSLPVFVLMTDEKFNTTGWIWDTGTETTIDNAAASMNAINAKIAVIDSSGDSKYVSANASALAQKTDSYNLSEEPIYYSIPTTATELPAKIRDAVKTARDSARMDVDLEFETVDGNEIEAVQFMKSYSTVSADPVESVESQETEIFKGVLRDTVLTYKLDLQNTTVEESGITFIKLRIKANWNGITLDSKEITLVIP